MNNRSVINQRILWDMDGVKTHLLRAVAKHINSKFPGLDWKEHQATEWNFWKLIEDKRVSNEVELFMHSPGFFRNMEPCHGSLEAYAEVSKHGHEIFICTTPLSGEFRERSMQEKKDWISDHLGWEAAANIIFSDDKTLIEADVIIDDKPHLTFNKLNICFKKWVIVDQPYNQVIPETEHYPIARIHNDWSNWREVFAELNLI